MGRPRKSEYHSEAGPFQNAFYWGVGTFAENELEPGVVVHRSVLSSRLVDASVQVLSVHQFRGPIAHSTAIQDNSSEQDLVQATKRVNGQ